MIIVKIIVNLVVTFEMVFVELWNKKYDVGDCDCVWGQGRLESSLLCLTDHRLLGLLCPWCFHCSQ